MGRVFNVLVTVLLIVVVAVVYVWTAQNSDQVVTLRLDLGRLIGAWELKNPTPITTLMGMAFGSGALFTGVLFLLWGMSERRGREAREQLLSGGRY